MEIPIAPANNYILGLQEKTKKQTKSGLYLPDSSQKPTSFTTIVAIGPDVERHDVGDRVLYKQYTEHELNYEGDDYIFVEETDIIGKVKQAKD